MEPRIPLTAAPPGLYKALAGLETYLATSSIEKNLIHLMKLRASQVNGCAYCIDMHWKDLRAAGETEQRLYGLDAWRESPYYTARERVALEWTESLTLITEGHVPDEVYNRVREQFDEKQTADLTMVAATINAWNRLAIALRSVPGKYQPAQKAG